MGAFLAAATGFPTVVFTAALVVVVLFWLLVALGAADAHGHAHMHFNSPRTAMVGDWAGSR
ncbi:hypothetical protein N7U49_23200 [Streptomyces sp. AD2-2]|nr:hypothetical protein N7U49_23200 [Streptomyces sp. AD2-2]